MQKISNQGKDAISSTGNFTLEVFRIHRTMDSVQGIMERFRFLVLNLRFSSDQANVNRAAFGAMVGLMVDIRKDIAAIFKNLEGDSVKLARLAARVIQGQRRNGLYRRALQRSAAKGAAQEELHQSLQFQRQAEGCLRRNEFELERILENIEEEVLSLKLRINKLKWATVEPIRIIAMTTLVESSQSEFEHTSLKEIALGIRKMSSQLTAFGESLDQEMEGLIDKLKNAMRFHQNLSLKAPSAP